MPAFESMRTPAAPDVLAPDGSFVRVLLRTAGGSMAHFELPPGATSRAVVHRTVDELWYILGGRGELWRSRDDREEVAPLGPGVCVSLPVGTRFQFRAEPDGPLQIVGVTMPPWPGDGEAVFVDGRWAAEVSG